MQFTLAALTAVLSTLAIASPTPKESTTPPNPSTYENIDIDSFLVRYHTDVIDVVDFKLSGNDATDLACTASNVTLQTVYTCGESKYRFALIEGTDAQFGLRLYHELGTAVGFYGDGDISTYCRAGGNGIDDRICNQVVPTTYVIDAQAS